MRKIILFLLLTSICHGDIEISEEVLWYDSARDFFFSISASESMTESIGYIYPPDGGAAGQALLTDGGDPIAVMSWGIPTTSAAHNLTSTIHSDTATGTVVRGDIIIGNATPKWERFAIGAANTFLKSDGTDAAWGTIDISDSTNLAVDVDHLKLTDDTLSFSDNEKVVSHSRQDSFLEQIDFTISEAGGTVTGSLEKEGTGDLTQFWSDDFDVLDCTPAKTVDLTASVGTDTSPAAAFVYILFSAKTTLVVNTSWPLDSVEHIRVASIVLQSAATTGTNGALMNRNWNDFAFGITIPKGGAIASDERMRKNHAQWDSGVALTVTGSGTGTVTLDTTSGFVYQLNKQSFPSQDMAGADDIHLVNLSGSEYSESVNLVADITTLADAVTSIGNNKFFNLVVWGAQNRTGENSHLMCNLPIGQYGKQGDATIDAEKFSVYTIPEAFRGVGFLIEELTFQFSSGGGGTWTLIQQRDLRNQLPLLVPGGGTTNNITTFVDSSFEVFDNLDDTKRIAFQASSITTGTTRTLTAPDVNTNMWADDGSVPLTANWDVGNFTMTMNGLTLDGTFTDGTTSIAGGNYTGVGNITGTDVDISAGTGDYTSTGDIDLNGPAGGSQLNIKSNADSSSSGIRIEDLDTTNLTHLFWQVADSGKFQLREGNVARIDLLASGGSMIASDAGIPLLITQDSISAAEPVFQLDQDDADQAFIDFVGTSGKDSTSSISSLGVGGDSSAAAVAGPLVASWTHELMVKIEINGTVYYIPAFRVPK